LKGEQLLPATHALLVLIFPAQCKITSLIHLVLDVLIGIDTAAGGGISTNLTWQDDSYDEDGFVVERKEGGDFLVIARLNSNVTSYTDSNLAAGTAYCFIT
jgi:hypothetical protein